MKTAVKLIRARCILLATAADPETYTTQRVFSTELELFVVVVLVVVVAPQDEFQFWFPNGDAPGRIVKKEKKNGSCQIKQRAQQVQQQKQQQQQ